MQACGYLRTSRGIQPETYYESDGWGVRTAECIEVSLREVLVSLWGLPLAGLESLASDEPMLTLCLPWVGIQEEEAVAIGAGNGKSEGVWWEQGKRAQPTTFVPSCPGHLRRHLSETSLLSL